MPLGVVGAVLGWPRRRGRVGRSGVLWVVGSSWWFSAFSTAAVGCGDALPQGPLSLGSSRDWGGEGTRRIRRRVDGQPPQAL